MNSGHYSAWWKTAECASNREASQMAVREQVGNGEYYSIKINIIKPTLCWCATEH